MTDAPHERTNDFGDGSGIEARTQALGRSLLHSMDRYRPLPAERVQDWLLTRALGDEAFRTRTLRFLDVLAAYDSGHHREVARLFREYFDADFSGIPRPLRGLIRVGRHPLVPPFVLATAARQAASVFARRFITHPGSDGIHRLVDDLAAIGRTTSFDLLGEAVLSESEAASYEARYIDLLRELAWHPLARTRTEGGAPILQVSLKLSSLTHHFTPVDFEGSIERVVPRLQRIAHAARDGGIGLTVDAEQYEVRDLVWEAFTRAFGLGTPFAEWADAGMVVQAYLRDAEDHVREVVAFARVRGTPFQVRLVKGAYWDYEVAVASAHRWPPPVFQQKAATDRSAETCIGLLIEAAPALHLAVGSHNPRTHAYARAVAEAHGLPAGAVEHQTLHSTSEAMSRALAQQGWPARDYVPVGDLLPGMAYLVRRILENSSQAGFLMQSRRLADDTGLLEPPPAVEDTAVVDPDDAPFERAPGARWFDPEFREGFEAALDESRGRSPLRLALPRGVQAEYDIEIRSPSDPEGGLIALVQSASISGARAAVTAAAEAQPAWAALAPADRASILRRAADLLLARGHEFAAQVVIEGGRDRAGAWGEVEEAVDFLRLYAVEAETLFEGYPDVRPKGVVAVIPPWNFSLAIPCGMTVAALVCGNAAVLKPAGQTPIVATRLVELLHEAGVPRGVVECVPGAGERAGRALVEDERVAMVAFTGSRGVGTWMHETVATTPRPDGRPRTAMTEMGGKNPAIVFSDADLDEAVAGVLESAFGHANQKCSAVSRVLVEQSLYPRFRDRLVDAASSLTVGPAHEASTQVNPVIDRRASERLVEAARTARSEGRVLLDRFGPRPGTIEHGPLIVELHPRRALSAKTATDELFGPILVLIPFRREAEAYRIANGTPYGLTSAVFSRSPRRIQRASRSIAAGHVYVNRTSTGARPGVEPFGGMKFSGTGPKVGQFEYLWAFVDRESTAKPSLHETVPPTSEVPRSISLDRWDVALGERCAIVRNALRASRAVDLLPLVAQAEVELAPASTVAAAGQDTSILHGIPRGRGLVHASAGAWLIGPLLAGNGVVCVGSPSLAPLVEALWAAGVPREVLGTVEDPGRLIDLARSCSLAFVSTDGGPYRELAKALAGPGEPQVGLRALISDIDGPQPGETGFLRRFAWPTVVGIRTLRHGATLEFGEIEAR